MKKLIFFLATFYCINAIHAQINVPQELETLLIGKDKFYDIKYTVENYFQTKKASLTIADSVASKKMERQRKFWNRYFYWAESHLDTKGYVADANKLTLEALNKIENNTNAAQATSYGNWEPIGPVSIDAGIGRVNRIAFHPTNPNIVYAGTPQAGLWKTTNAGTTWTCISNFLPNLGISGIVVDKINPNIIYVATGDGDAATGGFISSYGYIRYSVGVLKSTDGGNTWNQTGSLPMRNPNKKYVTYNLVTSSINNNLLLLATSVGLYRTEDAGATWTLSDLRFSNQSSDDSLRVWDVAFKPGSESIAYCTVVADNGSAFYRSIDGGKEFTTNNTVSFNGTPFYQTNIERIKIGVSNANSNMVYLLAGPGNVTAQTYRGIWQSTNAGELFTRKSSSPDILGYQDILNDFDDQNTYDLALAVSPTNANTLITGCLVVWRSTNGGTNLSEIVDYFEDGDNSNYIHADVHDLQYNPLDGKLWAATDGGVASSTNNGSSWTRHFNMQISAFYHYKPSNQDNLKWGGTQDNGTLLQNAGIVFDEFDGGDGYDVMTDKSPAGNNNDDYWVVNKKIYTDGVFDVNITPPSSDNYFPNLDMSPNNEDIIYAGYNKLWVSTDRGDNWVSPMILNPSIDADSVAANWCVATCPSNANRLYCAGKNPQDGEGVFRVKDANTNAPICDYKNNIGRGNKITDLAVNPNNSADVWATIGGFDSTLKVLRSTNSAADWQNLTGNLPNVPVNCILLDGKNIYVGTDIGVFYKYDSTGTDWVPFYNGLPRVPVTQMHKVLSLSNGQFYIEASTFGRGLWRSEIFGACSPNLTITSTLQGQQFFQAGAALNTSSIINGGVGTDVFLQSGNAIVLQPGFNAVKGNTVKAFIAPCNNGIPTMNTAIRSKTKKQAKKIVPTKNKK